MGGRALEVAKGVAEREERAEAMVVERAEMVGSEGMKAVARCTCYSA